MYYSPSEVAKILRVTTKTIHRLISDGEMPAIEVGKMKRIPKSYIHTLVGVETEQNKRSE